MPRRGKASEVNFRGRVDHSMRDSREAQLRQELTERTRELVEEAQRLSAGATLLEKDIETSADVLALRLEEALAAVYGQAGRDAAIAYNAAHGNDAEKRKDGVLAGIDAVPSIDGVILP